MRKLIFHCDEIITKNAMYHLKLIEFKQKIYFWEMDHFVHIDILQLKFPCHIQINTLFLFSLKMHKADIINIVLIFTVFTSKCTLTLVTI